MILSQPKYCPKCNASYGEEVVFCYEDGTSLQETTYSGTKEEVAKESRSIKESAGEVPSPKAMGFEDEFHHVPKFESFVKLSEELREQQKVISTLTRKHKQDTKAVDTLAKRVILVEEEMNRIAQELKTIMEKLSPREQSDVS